MGKENELPVLRTGSVRQCESWRRYCRTDFHLAPGNRLPGVSLVAVIGLHNYDHQD